MFTCILPSPLSPFCLPHASTSDKKGKEEQTSNPCNSFWKSPRQYGSLEPLSWAPPHQLCSSLSTACACSSFTFLRSALPVWRHRPSNSHTSSHGRPSWAWLVWNLFVLPQGGRGLDPIRGLGLGLSQEPLLTSCISTDPVRLYVAAASSGGDPLLCNTVTSWVPTTLSHECELHWKQSILCVSLKEVRTALPHKKCTFLLTVKLEWVTLLQ